MASAALLDERASKVEAIDTFEQWQRWQSGRRVAESIRRVVGHLSSCILLSSWPQTEK